MAEDELYDPFDPNEIAASRTVRAAVAKEQEQVVGEHLRARAEAYRRVFSNARADDVRMVLDDLRRFCRGEQAAWHEDPRIHALVTGRQEVYWRIKDHVTLTADELLEKYS